MLALALSAPGAAMAAAPDFVFQIPESQTIPGAGAGELDHPRGIAADPDSGHVYIADRRNARVSEYSAWGLFVKAWGWGVDDGSAELQTCGPAEAQEDPDPALCKKGQVGSGQGQMAFLAGGMAVDTEGNIWVGDLENLRVQKFSPDGGFLLMVGGDVNRTKVEEGAPASQRNLCPAVATDDCQAGIEGEGPGQLSNILDDVIAYSPAEGGRILVGDKGGIQFFDLNGNWVKTVPFSGPLAAFAGQTVNGLDVDKDGNTYFSLSGLEDLYKLDAAGAPVAPGKPGESKFDVGDPSNVAVDVEGYVYATDDPEGIAPHLEPRVLVFDVSGNKVVPTKPEEEEGRFFPYIPHQGPFITGIATNLCDGSEGRGNLYVSTFRSAQVSNVDAYGTAPIGCEDPPKRPPEILAQFATAVDRGEATVKAQVNPRFWPDTTYYVEYGTGKCSTSGGCPNKAPTSPLLLTGKSINAPVATAAVVLADLLPNTTYHYRFVAQSGGGGPVFGIDPDGREGPAQASEGEGLEATFRTARPAGKPSGCPNDAVRTGESAKLPDCRAFEMVSPLDKGNGDVALWQGKNALFPSLFEVHQSALSGERFTYTSAFAFGEAESAPYVSQYMAKRSLTGWGTEAISPPRTESPVEATTLFGNEFQGFSADLCTAGLRHYSVSTLADDAIEEYPNLYLRENCEPSPTYEALTTVQPPNRPATKYFELRIQGFSADGSHAIFNANDKLHPDAPALEESKLVLYEHTAGQVRFVCYLPDGTPSSLPCGTGTAAGTGGANTSSIRNAISADGSRIFWTAYTGSPGFGNEPGAPGQIYVRIDGTKTKEVSTTVAADSAWYWTAADDGSKAVFEFDAGPHKDELYELDVDTETPTLIAGQVEGPMGASEDASRIYFASREDLDGTGPADADDHNLYIYEADFGGGGGEFTFIMKLATGDVGGTTDEPAPIDEVPFHRWARVSADGLHVAFTSMVSPTPGGYDSTDAESGEPAQQVYLYDALEDELRCVSCNPTGARPSAQDIAVPGLPPFFAAARIQGWEVLLHAPRVLSDDGTRVFFESFEALVPRDTNSTWDVYQWEEEGKGTCKATSETFSEDSGGCVDLISSGLSSAKSTFLDADPSGDNIFFSTQSSLVKADYGLNDVYVARVGGGFPEPSEEAECEGEACQSPPPPPPELTPSSELASGPGNEPATKPRKQRRCPKGKRRVKRGGKVRCVKRRASKTRRAGR